MTPTRWQQVKHVLNEYLDHPDPQRTGLLDELCQGDADLRREVASLVESLPERTDFLETPPPLPDVVPERIGPYRILSLIGEGGMGIVYRALHEDDGFQMEVALKVMRPGLGNATLLRRFHRERQILARLNHPNIARLLDVGVTVDGRPYFVMELVDGLPLDQYIRKHSPPLCEKLRIFERLCDAVTTAHNTLIVHGDLKPSNVLVSAGGLPKLVDFGISRLLDRESSDLTTLAVRPMTPAYASPEQLRGEPISAGSDVYSLGLILYEMLTGSRPYQFESKAPEIVLRTIESAAPPLPSEAANDKELRGDIDNIVLKTIHVSCERRYQSAEQLAADLARYRTGLPVLARPDTLGYRAGKFFGRHRLALAAAAIVVVSLFAGMATTLWQARIARQERVRAERRFQDVRKLANLMMFRLDESLSNLPGGTEVRKELVAHSLQYLDSLAKEASADEELQKELGAAYEKMGDILGRPLSSNLGDTAGALESYQKSVAIREAVAASHPADTHLRQALATSYARMSAILKVVGEHRKALEFDQKAIAIRSQLLAQLPEDRGYRRDLASAYTGIGGTYSQLGEWPQVLKSREVALSLWQQLGVKPDAALEDRRGLSLAHSRMGSILAHLERHKEAAAHYQQSLQIDEKLARENPKNIGVQSAFGQTLLAAGLAQVREGGAAGAASALPLYRRALAIYRQIVSTDRNDARSQSVLATCLYRIGTAQLVLDNREEAFSYLDESLAIRERLSARNAISAGAKGEVAESRIALGDAYLAMKKAPLARQCYQQARQILVDLRDRKQANAGDASMLERAESRLRETEK